MSRRSTTSQLSAQSGPRPRHRAAVLLLIALIFCLGLVACGESSTGTDPRVSTASTTAAEASAARQLAVTRQVVQCMRNHGFNLRGPDAAGNISTRGVDLRSPRYKPTVEACVGKAAGKKVFK